MIEELKTFITVVEHNSFTKAADIIKLSQPSVSLHIKHLEDYFGTVLIKRSIKQKKISITPTGRLLYERAKHIINILEQTREDLKEYHNVIRGTLRIGASLTIGEYFLPSFLGDMIKKYPELKLEVTIENTDTICNMVDNMELDIGLIEGMVPSGKFIHEYFYEDNMVLATPYNYYKNNKKFSIDSLQDQTWISREEGSGTKEYLNVFLTSNRISPKNIIILGSNYAVKEAVKNGLGITLISYHVVKEDIKNKQISIMPTEQKYTRHFSCIFPKGVVMSKGTEVFLDMIKNFQQ
ncbi:putative RuBisCO transcriptional regulator [Gottschalkia purinilytica]|uniref:Putative RuBisCO transcriptional regulator n=1 Tax=Gottschalkia purinilytica TaxID=1503 RepID=A0A0L0WFE8_GOTPU|nr:LysR family transcriptional regulator [Gottschalkia purinilytica]KNF10203.1 putative RuBisCO transcriptional regulator [Gottschalkia purinilytica]